MSIEDFIYQPMISYLGNKRKLIEHIEKYLSLVKPNSCLDGFTGSGVVARMLKGNCKKLIVNDLEPYSIAIQKAYLDNINSSEYIELVKTIDLLNDLVCKLDTAIEPFISKYYCPKDTFNIEKGERCFYSKENGIRIDNYIYYLRKMGINEKFKDIIIGNLLVKCSINTNTSGVFKAFYKVDDIGHWGGRNEHDLQRILKPISIDVPIFFNNECVLEYSNSDINTFWDKRAEPIDFVYLDPPYNQHPYGSNYFMLNSIYNAIVDQDYIKNYKIDISSVSGIPKDWNRSDFNYISKAQIAFINMIKNTKAKYILISYNDNGFISKERILEILAEKGETSVEEIRYKNLNSRPSKVMNDKVSEYLFFVKCN
jgi:adenine-specific DNA-methyltransferase